MHPILVGDGQAGLRLLAGLSLRALRSRLSPSLCGASPISMRRYRIPQP
jgi:hypothetical protein